MVNMRKQGSPTGVNSPSGKNDSPAEEQDKKLPGRDTSTTGQFALPSSTMTETAGKTNPTTMTMTTSNEPNPSAVFAPIEGKIPTMSGITCPRDSPHTFASTYEQWNNTTNYATTSDDEEDDEAEENLRADDGSSTDMSHHHHPHNLFHRRPRLATRKLFDSDDDDDDDDDCSSLSMDTHEFILDKLESEVHLHRTADQGDIDSADSPPSPPKRVRTQENAKESTATQLEQDVRAKATGRASSTAAMVPRKRAPVLRDAKDEDFKLRRRQRLAERGSNKQPDVAAVAEARPSKTASGSSNPTVTPNPRSIAEMEAESKKRAAARPATMTRRGAPGQVLNAGASALSQQVAARNQGLRTTNNIGAKPSTHDRAALKQTFDGQDGPMLATKKSSHYGSSITEFSPQVANKTVPLPPSPLEQASTARPFSQASTNPVAQSLSGAQDRAATKWMRTDNGYFDDDNEVGPKIAPTKKKAYPASALQEALRTRQAAQIPMPESVSRASDRVAAKVLQEDDEQASDEDQGPQLAVATSHKKSPPSQPLTSFNTRPFATSQSVSRALDRAAAKMAKHNGGSISEIPDDDATTRSTSRKPAPSELQAAMKVRQATRSSTVPMPAAVSRALDRAGAKLETTDASFDEEDNGPQLAGPKHYTQTTSSDLQSAMQTRESSRTSAVLMPSAVSRAMDRAGAKMAGNDKGPQPCASTTRSHGPPVDLASAMQARVASRSSFVSMPTTVSRAMDRAGAKMSGETDEGPQLAASTSRTVSPPSDLQAALQARTASRSSNFAMPESVSRAMDRAGAKMGDGQDNEPGPQLAAARTPVTNYCDANPDRFELDDGSSKPKAIPGAHTSNESPTIHKKFTEYATEDEEDEGPTLAAPTAIEDRGRPGNSLATIHDMSDYENLTNEEDASQYSGHNDFTIVPATYAGQNDPEIAQEDEEIFDDIQEGLIVTEQQAGAYAVQGIDATGEDDLYHDGFDPTNVLIETEATAVVESRPSAPVINASTLDVIPLEAELFDQPVFQADLYEEADLEDDPKFRRRLRIMQGIILCSSLFGVVFVVFSIIAGLDSGLPPAPTIDGWRSVGNAVFGPNNEESQIFFASSAAISASGTRLVVAAPGTDQDDDINTGEIYIWDEIVLEYGNSTWEMTASLPGPGPSDIVMSPVTMASTGDRIAVGYPFSSLGGQVQVFEDRNGWIQTETITRGPNATTEESWFGFAVDMSDKGEYLAIGSPLDSLSGSVSVLRRSSDGSWVPLGAPIPAQGPAELFGWSISLVVAPTSLRIAVGAPSYNTETGLVRVYEWVNTKWKQVGATLQGVEVLNRFGETCALSGDGTVLAVGTRGSPFQKGNVQIFRQVEENWIADEQVIEGSEPGGGFGAALSITPDGNTVAIGGPGNNAFGEGSGHVQVWSHDGKIWKQQGSSIGGDTNAAYGSSVALTPDGQRVVGGAPLAPFDGSIPENGYFQVYDREDSTGN